MNINTDKIAPKKSSHVRELILNSIEILEGAGVPVDRLTPRRLERMSMCFLSLCRVCEVSSWHKAESLADGRILRTREIIEYINEHFEENISSGSYDDIRRKDLVMPVGMSLIVKSANNPDADTNDGTRGYAVEDKFADLVRSFGSEQWRSKLDSFEIDQDYIDQLECKRESKKLVVKLEEGVSITLDNGPHNKIQKAIVEEFLPIFGYGATVLYIGDTSEKQMHKYSEKMKEIGLNIADRGMLPDIVAFSENNQWVYLIEAVHSSNPLNAERCIELKRTVLSDCPYGVVFVTAFLSRKDFSKWMTQIAWETEVWLADNPTHMIHFNGDRFLGPHASPPNHEENNTP